MAGLPPIPSWVGPRTEERERETEREREREREREGERKREGGRERVRGREMRVDSKKEGRGRGTVHV